MKWFIKADDPLKFLIDKIQKKVDKMKAASEVGMKSPIMIAIDDLKEDLDELYKTITKTEEK